MVIITRHGINYPRDHKTDVNNERPDNVFVVDEAGGRLVAVKFCANKMYIRSFELDRAAPHLVRIDSENGTRLVAGDVDGVPLSVENGPAPRIHRQGRGKKNCWKTTNPHLESPISSCPAPRSGKGRRAGMNSSSGELSRGHSEILFSEKKRSAHEPH